MARYKPGQSGNPLGGQKHDPEMKRLKNLTKSELIEIGNLIIKKDISALHKVVKDEKSTALQRMIASVVVKIIAKGDMAALDHLLNRLIGKVKDEIAFQGEINAPQIIVTLPDNEHSAKQSDDFGF
jgi:hypothetical protein